MRKKFKSKRLKILRNLSYREGGADILAGQVVRSVICPRDRRKHYYDKVWINGEIGPIMLAHGEYEIIK